MMSVVPFCSRLLLSPHVRTADDTGQGDVPNMGIRRVSALYHRDHLLRTILQALKFRIFNALANLAVRWAVFRLR